MSSNIIFQSRKDSQKGLCARCQRRQTVVGEIYCFRCKAIVGKDGVTIPKDVTICLRCGRRRPESNYAYCDRCLILIERETGKKPLPLNIPVEIPSIDEMLNTDVPKTPQKKLCKRCERREPDEGEEYCFRCKILISREKGGIK